jgi:hypothetical protein
MSGALNCKFCLTLAALCIALVFAGCRAVRQGVRIVRRIGRNNLAVQFDVSFLEQNPVTFVRWGPATALENNTGAAFAAPNCNGRFVLFPTV